MKEDWISLCRDVVNGRDMFDIYRHANGEMDELHEEIVADMEGDEPGEDGITGEAVDVILCMLDVIAQDRKLHTMDEVEALMLRKYSKWMEKYSDIIKT